MNTECSAAQLEFQGLGRQRVVAGFDGGHISSDGGALLLREMGLRLGLTQRLASCFTDHRDPAYGNANCGPCSRAPRKTPGPSPCCLPSTRCRLARRFPARFGGCPRARGCSATKSAGDPMTSPGTRGLAPICHSRPFRPLAFFLCAIGMAIRKQVNYGVALRPIRSRGRHLMHLAERLPPHANTLCRRHFRSSRASTDCRHFAKNPGRIFY